MVGDENCPIYSTTQADLYVLQSNRMIQLINVSEQYVHKSSKMAHQTYLYLYLLLYMYRVVMSTGAVMGNR